MSGDRITLDLSISICYDVYINRLIYSQYILTVEGIQIIFYMIGIDDVSHVFTYTFDYRFSVTQTDEFE